MWLFALACSPSPPVAVDHRIELARQDKHAVRFVVVGDIGNPSSSQRAVARAIGSVCQARGCDFGLLLGDNLYPDGMTRPDDPRMDQVFTEAFADVDLEFYAVLGNHDYGRRHLLANAQHQIDWAARQDRFHLPQSYYRFGVGQAAFWALDTDAVFWNGLQPQSDWLDETLGGDDPLDRWRVVFGHHPYRSNGPHGNAGTYEGWSNLPYASGNALQTLFSEHVQGRAHLYIAGHDHNLQSLQHNGLELIVSGSGSSARELVDRGNQLRSGHAVPGFVWISLDKSMNLAFFDENGALLDEISVPRPEIQTP